MSLLIGSQLMLVMVLFLYIIDVHRSHYACVLSTSWNYNGYISIFFRIGCRPLTLVWMTARLL